MYCERLRFAVRREGRVGRPGLSTSSTASTGVQFYICLAVTRIEGDLWLIQNELSIEHLMMQFRRRILQPALIASAML